MGFLAQTVERDRIVFPSSQKRNEKVMPKIREAIQAAKELPNQIKSTVRIAIVALALAIASIFISLMGVRRGN